MAANGRGQMRPHNAGRTPSFVVVGLMVVIAILGFNYWNVSSKNSMLAHELSDMTERLRLTAVKKMSIEKRSEILTQKVKDTENDMISRTKTLTDRKDEEITNIRGQLDAKNEEIANSLSENRKCQSSLEISSQNANEQEAIANGLKQENEDCNLKRKMAADEKCKPQAPPVDCVPVVQKARQDLLQVVHQKLGPRAIAMLQEAGVDTAGTLSTGIAVGTQAPQQQQPEQQLGNHVPFVEAAGDRSIRMSERVDYSKFNQAAQGPSENKQVPPQPNQPGVFQPVPAEQMQQQQPQLQQPQQQQQQMQQQTTKQELPPQNPKEPVQNAQDQQQAFQDQFKQQQQQQQLDSRLNQADNTHVGQGLDVNQGAKQEGVRLAPVDQGGAAFTPAQSAGVKHEGPAGDLGVDQGVKMERQENPAGAYNQQMGSQKEQQAQPQVGREGHIGAGVDPNQRGLNANQGANAVQQPPNPHDQQAGLQAPPGVKNMERAPPGVENVQKPPEGNLAVQEERQRYGQDRNAAPKIEEDAANTGRDKPQEHQRYGDADLRFERMNRDAYQNQPRQVAPPVVGMRN